MGQPLPRWCLPPHPEEPAIRLSILYKDFEDVEKALTIQKGIDPTTTTTAVRVSSSPKQSENKDTKGAAPLAASAGQVQLALAQHSEEMSPMSEMSASNSRWSVFIILRGGRGQLRVKKRGLAVTFNNHSRTVTIKSKADKMAPATMAAPKQRRRTEMKTSSIGKQWVCPLP